LRFAFGESGARGAAAASSSAARFILRDSEISPVAFGVSKQSVRNSSRVGAQLAELSVADAEGWRTPCSSLFYRYLSTT
jgi:hypothetical protein